MSKYAGTNFTVFLVDGYNLIASTSDAITIDRESITQETNPFGATSIQNTPINIEKGMFTVGDGFFDATTDALHGATGSAHGVSRIVCASIYGDIIGKPFIGYQGVYDQKYVVKDKTTDLTKADVSYLVSGDTNEGVIVQHLATFTADWDTKTGGANATDAPVDFTLDPANPARTIASNTLANPTVVTMSTQHGSPIVHNLTTGQKVLFSGSNSTPSINGVQTVTVTGLTTFTIPVNVTVAGTAGSFVLASTVAGGVGYMQVTAYTGFTGFVNKIMHSPDDSTYAAFITFTDLAAVAGPAKERKTATGTIDRYLSNQGDVTGAGSVTVFAGLARN